MKRSIRSSSQLCEKKRILRCEKQRQTANLPQSYITASDGVIINKLLKLDELNNARTVFLYYSVGREVSTVQLIDKLLCVGKNLALPVCGSDGMMNFHPFKSRSALRPGRFGIPEPPTTNEVRPSRSDIIIVPALCCDRIGNRLGHGAGYYDRYLADNQVFSICLCRKALLEESIPTEDTDIAVSLVLTD